MAEHSVENPHTAPPASATAEAQKAERENPSTRRKEAMPPLPAPEESLVGRLKIAYNQFWMERHEKKAAHLKKEVDELTIRSDILQEAKKGIESELRGAYGQSMSGAELRELDKQRNELLNKRDLVQSEFEKRDNKVKLYTNERDRIIDNFLNSYNEKLTPLEQELERLQTKNDEADLDLAVLEARHRARAADLAEIEGQKNRIEDRLRGAGMKDDAIAKSVDYLNKILQRGRNDIRTEKERLAIQKDGIYKKIAKIDAKANPYRDKREKFVRMKSGRPIVMSVNERVREEPFSGREDVRAHPRPQAPKESPVSPEPQGGAVESGRVEREVGGEYRATAAYVALWNEHLAKSYGDAAKEKIDASDFLFLTTLKGSDILNFNEFKNITLRYYKLKKVPVESLTESVWAGFFEKATKEEEGGV